MPWQQLRTRTAATESAPASLTHINIVPLTAQYAYRAKRERRSGSGEKCTQSAIRVGCCDPITQYCRGLCRVMDNVRQQHGFILFGSKPITPHALTILSH